jgi:hypothetical protein
VRGLRGGAGRHPGLGGPFHRSSSVKQGAARCQPWIWSLPARPCYGEACMGASPSGRGWAHAPRSPGSARHVTRSGDPPCGGERPDLQPGSHAAARTAAACTAVILFCEVNGDHSRYVRCGCPDGGQLAVTAISSFEGARREPRRPLRPGLARLGVLVVFSGPGAREGSRDAAGPGVSGAGLRAVRSRCDRCPVTRSRMPGDTVTERHVAFHRPDAAVSVPNMRTVTGMPSPGGEESLADAAVCDRAPGGRR